MRYAPTLLLAGLMPLIGGCLSLSQPPSNPNLGTTRMQGQLSAVDGQLLFTPCREARRFVVKDTGGTGVLQEAATLAKAPQDTVFADLRGRLTGSQTAASNGQFEVTGLYRLESNHQGCDDPMFRALTVHADGQSPDWQLNANSKGMIIDRPGKPTLALPFLEEQTPEGGLNLSSEANGQRVDFWVAPQRCVVPSTGAVRQLKAELRIDGERWQGCAYYGGGKDI